MKKLLITLLIVCASCLLLATAISAATYYVDGDGNIVEEGNENVAYMYTLADNASSLGSIFVYDINETKIIIPDMPSYTGTLKPGDWDKTFGVYHVDDTEKATSLASQITEVELHENVYLDGAYSTGSFAGYTSLEKISFYGKVGVAGKGGFFGSTTGIKEMHFYGKDLTIPSTLINELNQNVETTLVFHEGSSGTLSSGGNTLPTFAKLSNWKIIINPSITPSNAADGRLGATWGQVTSTTGWELIMAIPSKASYTDAELEELKTSHGFCSRAASVDTATVKEATVMTWCELGYDEHTGEEMLVKDSLLGYFGEMKLVSACTKCMSRAIEKEAIGAIFENYGYSATEEAINGSYSVSQFYGINKANLDRYVEITGAEVKYGFVVSISNDPLAEENKALIGANKTFITEQSKLAHNYFAINVVGFVKNEEKDTLGNALTFCAYVIDNGAVYYLDNGQTVTSVTMKSYNDIIDK